MLFIMCDHYDMPHQEMLRLPQLRRAYAGGAVFVGVLVLLMVMVYRWDFWEQRKKAEDATLAMDWEGFGPEKGDMWLCK